MAIKFIVYFQIRNFWLPNKKNEIKVILDFLSKVKFPLNVLEDTEERYDLITVLKCQVYLYNTRFMLLRQLLSFN